jgi:Ca2+-binding RTX toxin-like protein
VKKPFASWTTTFRKLGYRLIRRKPRARKIEDRRMAVEPLEKRELLAADLSLDSYYSDGDDWHVQYEVSNQAATAFEVGVYRSSDGVTQDELLTSHRVDQSDDLAVGLHDLVITPEFTDVQEDYQLIVSVDSDNEVSESDETNNAMLFEGGVFKALDGTVHVHGIDLADDIDVTQPGKLKVVYNGTLTEFTAADVTEVHIRTHGGHDDARGGTGVNKPMWSFGGTGDDILYDGKVDDYLEGGEGNDLLKGRTGNDTLHGQAGDDELIGDAGDDTLYGGEGDDLLKGEENADYLDGGPGNDTLKGGNAEDVLIGGAGNDLLEGNEKADILDGGAGDDTLKGGYGDDTITGGEGADVIEGNPGADVIDGGPGNDTIKGGAGGDTINAGDGDDYLEGNEYADTLDGGAGNDTIKGGGGDDTLIGGLGDDTLEGNQGNDSLDGGWGIDTLEGVTETNTAPIGAIADVLVNEDAAPTIIDLAAAFDDAEHLDSELTFTLVTNTNPTLFSAATIDQQAGTLTLTYAPNAYGSSELTVRATDPLALYVDATFAVQVAAVNDAPTTVGLADLVVDEDAAPVTVDLLSGFADVEDATTDLIFEIVGNTNTELIASATIVGGTGLMLVFAENKNGQADLTVRATDTGGLFVDTDLRVTVNPVNDAPTTTGIADVVVDEDSLPTTIDFSTGFSDVDDVSLSYTIAGNTNPGLFSTFSLDETTGELTLNYAPDAFGQADVTIRAADAGGLFVDANLHVTVNPINDAPTTSGLTDVAVDEDSAPTVIDLHAAFADIDDADSELTYAVTGNTNAALFDSVTIDEQVGTLTLTYAANANGAADLTVRATDTGGLFVDTDLHVTVNSVNDAPTTSGIADVLVDEDAAPTVIDLHTAFADVEDADAALTYAVTGNTNTALFDAVTIDEQAGTLTLAYATNANGAGDITVQATDTDGATVDSTFTVTVAPVNDAPTTTRHCRRIRQ